MALVVEHYAFYDHSVQVTLLAYLGSSPPELQSITSNYLPHLYNETNWEYSYCSRTKAGFVVYVVH